MSFVERCPFFHTGLLKKRFYGIHASCNHVSVSLSYLRVVYFGHVARTVSISAKQQKRPDVLLDERPLEKEANTRGVQRARPLLDGRRRHHPGHFL